MARDDLVKEVGDEHVKLVFEALERFAIGDPNFARRYASLLRKRSPTFYGLVLEGESKRALPLPTVSTITCAQATIYDNWQHTNGKRPSRKKGEKGARKDRFKVTVEAWAVGEDVKVRETNKTFTGTAPLLDGPDLLGKLQELQNPKHTLRPFKQMDANDVEGALWEAYRLELEGIAGSLRGIRAGPMFSASQGTYFHLGQYAVVNDALIDRRDDEVELVICTNEGDLRFTNFVTNRSTGTPISVSKQGTPTNAILTSRMVYVDRGDLKKWRTN